MIILPDRYEWQIDQVARYGRRLRRACYASPRVGKTLETCDELGLADDELRNRSCVVSPLTAAPMWAEYAEAFGYNVVDLFSGPVSESGARLNAAIEPFIAVTAWERLAGRSFVDPEKVAKPGVADALRKAEIRSIILDESHYMAGNAKWARVARRLAWEADWVRLLSGTPIASDYGDLWGQMVALDKRPIHYLDAEKKRILLPEDQRGWGSSFTDFAYRYLIMDDLYPQRVKEHNPARGPELQAKLNAWATFVRREDVFGPPHEPVRNTVEVELPSSVEAKYRALAKEWVLEAEGVVADHIFKRLIRLQQITAGYLVNDAREIVDLHDAKVRAIAEDVRAIIRSGEKVLVYHRFVHEGELLREALQRVCGTRATLSVLRNDVEVRERHAITKAFNESAKPQVALAQTRIGGISISFAGAAYTLFASQSFKFIEEKQAIDRSFKPGETRFVTFYRSPRTVDYFIAATLDSHLNVHTSVMNADRREMVFGPLQRPKFR